MKMRGQRTLAPDFRELIAWGTRTEMAGYNPGEPSADQGDEAHPYG